MALNPVIELLGRRLRLAVIGGGPGGSTAAWHLARAGARTLLVDGARFPRVKLCAGWVTPAVWRRMQFTSMLRQAGMPWGM